MAPTSRRRVYADAPEAIARFMDLDADPRREKTSMSSCLVELKKDLRREGMTVLRTRAGGLENGVSRLNVPARWGNCGRRWRYARGSTSLRLSRVALWLRFSVKSPK